MQELEHDVLFTQPLDQALVLHDQRTVLEGPLHGRGQVIQVKGLGQIVIYPFAQRGNGRIGGRIAGHQAKDHVRAVLLGLFQDAQPVHTRHHQIAQDQGQVSALCRNLSPQPFQGCVAIGHRFDPIAGAAQETIDQRQALQIVVYDQDTFTVHLCLNAKTSRDAGHRLSSARPSQAPPRQSHSRDGEPSASRLAPAGSVRPCPAGS